jgi:hypothetical protein
VRAHTKALYNIFVRQGFDRKRVACVHVFGGVCEKAATAIVGMCPSGIQVEIGRLWVLITAWAGGWCIHFPPQVADTLAFAGDTQARLSFFDEFAPSIPAREFISRMKLPESWA